jgi:hypothetical protein
MSYDEQRRWLVWWAFFGGWANNPLRATPKPRQVYRNRFDTYEAQRFARGVVASYGRDEVAFSIIDLEVQQSRPPVTTPSFASDWPLQRRPPQTLAEMLGREKPQ